MHDLPPDALAPWPVSAGARATLLNVSENLTYRVEAPDGSRAILRVHRPGYHSRAAIASELDWLEAVGTSTDLSIARILPGRDGARVQTVTLAPGDARHAVLFEHLPGGHPAPGDALVPAFEALGAQTARLHDHAARWPRPPGFTRFAWDERAVFGEAATWGDWRAAPNLSAEDRATLERVERTVAARLAAYGKAPARYGLIHADLRLANVLMDGDRLHLIDFDDCGFGWHMYDFAAAISFMEDDPAIPALKAAWCAGYRRVRPLPAADEAMIDTMVMLRRLALLAWIGSHMEATEPQALAPHFASTSAQLGRAYLEKAEFGGDLAPS